MEASVSQHTQLDLDPLWIFQPMKLVKQWCDVIEPLCGENQASSTIKGRLEYVPGLELLFLANELYELPA